MRRDRKQQAHKGEIDLQAKQIYDLLKVVRQPQLIEGQDISDVMLEISELLDESIVVDDDQVKTDQERFAINPSGKKWNLAETDFEKLKHEFKDQKFKNIACNDLLAFLQRKLKEMLSKNSTRRDIAERLQEIIDRYNSGGANTENIYEELVDFAASMKEEEERHVREGLTEDELELFDLIKKDSMTKAEKQKVKLAAKKLLSRLIEEQPPVLIQDWFKDAQTRRVVRSAVEEVLDLSLPETYNKSIFKKASESVFDTILDYAIQGLKYAA